MQKPNTLTPLQKLIISQNREELLTLKSYSRMKKLLESLGILKISPQVLYNELYKSILQSCENAKFVSFSVGYRSCKKGCPCYVKNLSEKMKHIKSQYTDEKKAQIRKTLKDTLNKQYGVDNVFQLDAIQEKSRHTKKDRYGDENYRNSEKIIETNIERYGVDNPMKSERVRLDYYSKFYDRNFDSIAKKVKQTKKDRYGDENYRNSEKIIETNIERYGVDNPAKSSCVKDKISKNLRATLYDQVIAAYSHLVSPMFTKDDYINGIDNLWKCVCCNNIINKSIINGLGPRCTICFPYSVSAFEREVQEYIESLGFDNLIFNDREIIGPKELDIVVPDKRISFECDGVYRHCELSGQKDKYYHLEKTEAALKAGYSLMHILDVDWYNSREVIQSMIKHKLGLSKKLYAKHGVIKPISKTEATEFFTKNHLHHSVPFSHSMGLYINDTLVAAMSFSKSRYEKTARWELLRFCNILDHTVIGAASKLLKYFAKHNLGSIITYADRSYGTSQFYELIGFEKIKNTAPGYRYVKDCVLYSRLKFQKHKLQNLLETFDPNKTEWQNMQANGFDRIWDCGHQAYIYRGENSLDSTLGIML